MPKSPGRSPILAGFEIPPAPGSVEMGWPPNPWLVRSAMAAPMRYQLLPVLPVMRFIRGVREDWASLQPAVAKPDSSAAITHIAEDPGAGAKK